jgi:hypothetical protein
LTGLAVDQRRSRRPYKTSTVNPSQSIDRIALGKFIRKPRTQEQLEQSLLFNTIPPPQHITKRSSLQGGAGQAKNSTNS